MREYGAISPQFWTGRTGRQIRKLGPMAQVVALYLLTAPGSTMLGLYYLPIGTIVHETGIPEGDVHEVMADLDEMGFAHYDADNEVVWVVEMARFQIAEELKTSDNRHKYVVKESPRFAASPLYDRWYDQYHIAFNLPERKVKAKATQAPSKGGGHRAESPSEVGQTPPPKQRQDQGRTGQEQLNPREHADAPAREARTPEAVEPSRSESPEPPAYLALIAVIADAANGKFDGAGVGSTLQRAFDASLRCLAVDDATARRMGELAPHPERIWPSAKGFTKGFVSLGWVMGKRFDDGTYNAPWVLAWVEAARNSLAADAQKAARAAAPPAPPARPLRPENIPGTPEYIAANERNRIAAQARLKAAAAAEESASAPASAVIQ